MDVEEKLWRQYSMHVDLYKHYLKLAIEINVFYYAITGAIFSYYLTHQDSELLKWSLLFPLAMSVAFAVFFTIGANLMSVSRQEVFNIRDMLKFESAPELKVLSVFLRIFAILMIIVAVSILILMCKT